MKNLFKIIFCLFYALNTISLSYADDNSLPENYISARDYFTELNYDIVWDSSSKSADISNNNMSFYIDNKGLVSWNNCIFFNDSALLYNNRLYICNDIINVIDMLSNAVENNIEAPDIIKNMDTQNIVELNANEILQKFYNIDPRYLTVSGACYDNNTCSIMYESDNCAYFIDFDIDSKNIISIDRTINKNNYKSRSYITNKKLGNYTPKIFDFLKTFNNYENLETIFYYIPNNNNSTVCVFLKDSANNFYTYEFIDTTLEPMGLHTYSDIHTAINDINKYIK